MPISYRLVHGRKRKFTPRIFSLQRLLCFLLQVAVPAAAAAVVGIAIIRMVRAFSAEAAAFPVPPCRDVHVVTHRNHDSKIKRMSLPQWSALSYRSSCHALPPHTPSPTPLAQAGVTKLASFATPVLRARRLVVLSPVYIAAAAVLVCTFPFILYAPATSHAASRFSSIGFFTTTAATAINTSRDDGQGSGSLLAALGLSVNTALNSFASSRGCFISSSRCRTSS